MLSSLTDVLKLVKYYNVTVEMHGDHEVFNSQCIYDVQNMQLRMLLVHIQSTSLLAASNSQVI